MDIHSALHTPQNVSPTQRFEIGDSVALVHDLHDVRLPKEYEFCDVIYGEMPWRAGYDEFNKRAGVRESRAYSDLLKSVANMVVRQTIPTIVVTGKHALRYFPEPIRVMDIELSGATKLKGVAAYALVYGADLDVEWSTTLDAVLDLASKYNRGGDYCCGYGRTARAFLEAGKSFTVSDHNPHCVGYIAAHAHEWLPQVHHRTRKG